MDKLTFTEWEQLSREEKKQAILEFKEPENIRQQTKVSVNWLDKNRFM